MRKQSTNKFQVCFAFALFICFPGDRFSEVREHLIVVLTEAFTPSLTEMWIHCSDSFQDKQLNDFTHMSSDHYFFHLYGVWWG